MELRYRGGCGVESQQFTVQVVDGASLVHICILVYQDMKENNKRARVRRVL